MELKRREVLANLRAEIERVDATLIDLLRRRVALSSAAGIIKASIGIPVHDPEREQTLLVRFAPLPGAVRAAYIEVIRVCRENQQAHLPRPDDGGDPGTPA